MTRQTPRSLRALGGRALPPTIEVQGESYAHRQTFKDDFFAVTAMYEGRAGRVILKVNRQADFLLIPLRWLGLILAWREQACFERLEGVEGVPRYLGRWNGTGIVRQYVEGHAMQKGERVPDDFHERLSELVGAMHRRGMAYVDLEKCENVLVGDDGKPHLFDFQISWFVSKGWGGELAPMRWLRGRLQRADHYHLGKLHRRTRPDQLSPKARDASYTRPGYIRLFGACTRPLKLIRRRILDRIDPRRGEGERGRVEKEETVGVN